MLYLDHAASSPLRPEAWSAMQPFAEGLYANSSGSHALSRRAKNTLEDARDEVAGILNALPGEIVFTGGGTESDNLALKGAAQAGGGRRGVVVSSIEHDAVLASAEFLATLGCSVHHAPVGRDGVVDPDVLAECVDTETGVVSVMSANNETGARQPVAAIVDVARSVSGSVVVHTDAVQGYVGAPVDVEDLGVDLLTIAAHKFGGPKGVGILYVRSGVTLEPLIHGGGHELGRRSGTHDVMGAVGMAAAMRATESGRADFDDRVRAERDTFESTLRGLVPATVITIAGGARLPQTSHVRIPGVRNETMLVRLDDAGVAASAASACQSGAATVSHVLEAMGMTPDEARECLRFSFGWSSEPGEGEKAASIVADLASSLAGS